LKLIEDAVKDGARRAKACAVVGLSPRSAERWRAKPAEDGRQGPKTAPPNKLTTKERMKVIELVNEPRFRDLSPNQIVPLLADGGWYFASESTFHRVLREEGLLSHRGRAKAPVRRPPREHAATGPNQVWSWDITYSGFQFG